uniref:TSA: Wollemia nobilis Ref_Wollemi_Transcript_10520_1368 transcribed RNA sequence n=1 Tax=Wollemia nobilis TaxID=56998 RepID=A0A0C9S8T2_9CONI
MAAAEHNKPATGYPAATAPGQPSYAMGPGPAYSGGYPQSYPQAYPAYPQPYPAANPYNGRFDRGNNFFFRRILAIVITLAVLAGIAILITWLVLRPHRPKFYVESATVTRMNLTGNSLDSKMEFNVSSRNPNKKIGIFYDAINAKALFDSQMIAFNRLEEFYQGHKNTTVLTCPLSSNSLLLEGSGSGDLSSDLSKKKVKMTIKLEAWIRFKVGGWTTRHYDMEVYCDVAIDEWNGTSGRLSQRRRCDVEI